MYLRLLMSRKSLLKPLLVILLYLGWVLYFSQAPVSVNPHFHNDVPITDIRIVKCCRLIPFSSCSTGKGWERLDKDVYLGTKWFNRAFIAFRRQKSDKESFIDQIRVSRIEPRGDGWIAAQSSDAQLWTKRTDRAGLANAITAIDLLFGADAVEVRQNWELAPTNSLYSANLHLSGGNLGRCRDVEEDQQNTCEADPQTLEFVARVLDAELPDLVVLTGDQVNGETSPDVQSALFKFAEPLIARSIPYVTIFGNHDDEGNLSRAEQMGIIEKLPFSLSQAGPASVDGVGNYIQTITNHNASLHFYFLDAHKYSPDESHYPGYAWLKESQISWFSEEAQSHSVAKDLNVVFIHIPLPEYRAHSRMVVGGVNLEPSTAPTYNSGALKAFAAANVSLVVAGHDHANDACLLESSYDQEVWLCYGGGSGLGGYMGKGAGARKLRIFEFDLTEMNIRTWKRLEYGDMGRVDVVDLLHKGKVVT
ncbi:Phosphatase DCR2 [Neolecta irregularis DAH-3]|uniref:Phosphatase DCR2 n=1 Tax=Neolecta irregularis (strain DAH-3) TaxID=1198029 RepID=A0A1U7LKA2_NEOID|nr:Phosphatase DCR2 [Neolecta irregularis DAH-3]|eukprot:OLL23069.1 Phosphatase DCR2 [Neolecta irregularis DAH-3]